MSQKQQIIAQNRKAHYEYHIEENIEAGIVLEGSEVKSLRLGRCSIIDGFVQEVEGQLWLYGINISEYNSGRVFGHSPLRARKLLLHKKQIKKLIGKIRIKGYTLIALSFYFNNKQKVKVNLGLAKGKKLHDKRQAEKERDWQREKAKIFKENK